jgi:hypothetical protein
VARTLSRPEPLADGAVVTKAALRAAERLGVPNRSLARMLGLSEATVSRMGTGTYLLKPGDKPFELALMFLRVFRSLDALAGGDEQTARTWLRSDNLALGAIPLTLIESLAGMVTVVGYLDARRARG